jgi:hypothetical protein
MKMNRNIVRAVRVLRMFEQEGRQYWLKAMVLNGDVSQAEAGFITYYKMI